jgi:cobalt-zinc-cadmium efflux system protein
VDDDDEHGCDGNCDHPGAEPERQRCAWLRCARLGPKRDGDEDRRERTRSEPRTKHRRACAVAAAAPAAASPAAEARRVKSVPASSYDERALTPSDHGHSHVHIEADADSRRLTIALALILALMVVEVVAGVLASSLALVSDAAHMLTDAGALVLSLVVIRLVRRPAGGNLTFGLRRAEILSAQANGVTLLVLAGLIVYEAIRRLIDPPQTVGAVVLVVALVGIGVNLLAAGQLARANRRSLNIRGSYLHLVTDLFAFVATAVAGLIIITTGFDRADPIASLLVAGIMLWAAFGLLRDSGRVLLEAAPEGMSVTEIGESIAAFPHVESVHDLHVWEVSSGFPALSAHVLVRPDDDCHGVRRGLERLLLDRFGIEHTTLQVDHSQTEKLIAIERQGASDR